MPTVFGSYYLLVQIDPDDTFHEVNTVNNNFASVQTIAVV